MANKCVQLIVRGRVTGVYFRASAQREAKRLGITGWVRNRNDGSIEIMAEGDEDGDILPGIVADLEAMTRAA